MAQTEQAQSNGAEKLDVKDIILDFPYQTPAGVALAKVTMRRSKVKDQKAVRKTYTGDADIETALLARLCGLVPEDLDDMDEADYQKLQNTYLSFRTATDR